MLLEIAITLIMAKILNYSFEKFKQPGVVGEIVAGIILGPCCIGSLSGSSVNIFGSTLFKLNFNLNSTEFRELAFIGIVFLLFIIGLDTNIADLKKTSRSGILTAVFGIIIPFFFGFIIGFVFHFDILMCMGIGAIFFATSATISMRVLSDLDMLSTRVGLTLQTAGIISDVIGLFIFSLIIGQGHPLLFVLKIFIFLIFILIVGFFVIKYTIKKGITRQKTMLVLSLSLIICFLFSAFAEDMGLAAIIGAFIAGLIIKKTPQSVMITGHIKTIGYTFFIPLFFVWIGASFNFLNLTSSNNIMPYIFFMAFFILLGLLGNFIGGAIGAKISGLNKKDSLSIGFSMMPIMGMALIFVTTEVERGIFGDPTDVLAQLIKTATLMLMIISCLLTPHLLKRNIRSTFLKNNKTKLIEKIGHILVDRSTYKISFAKKYDSTWATKQLLFNIFICSIFLQFSLTIMMLINKSSFFNILFALCSCFIGTFLGYITLKYILLQKARFHY
ncbi:MAG: hypothetical protein BV456_09705 [Thermoplasmata archaeon M8B2D]|nr:MAG: hypothetical protein BV456_09705 [Thermoplasmata archaeon M8B2D]